VDVLVIGSTGKTGRILVRRLLESGHNVTAFARNPADISQAGQKLRVVQGDARDRDSVANAVREQEAVISVFGPRSLKADDLSETLMRNIVAAMKTHGVKRVINLSAAGVGDSQSEMPFVLRMVLIPLVLGKVYADKTRGEAVLFSSGLEFVNVRPGRLSDGPARGGVKASLHADGLKLQMTREDLANFLIEQITSSTWLGQSPLLGY
jgi:uncharacterized protein YbjT (DUF2867 family)